jgi:hypothetical protein
MQLRLARLVGLALAGSACSLLTPLDSLSRNAGEGAVDAALEAASYSDGRSDAGETLIDAKSDGALEVLADAKPDSGEVNVHPTGTFEIGGCGFWGSYQGMLSSSPTARTGVGSCQVCTQPTTTDLFSGDDTGTGIVAEVGATYRAEAWVRTSGAAPAPGSVLMTLRTIAQSGAFTILDQADSPTAPIDANWTHLQTRLTATKPGGILNVVVLGQHRTGACFLVDDVSLVRVQ